MTDLSEECALLYTSCVPEGHGPFLHARWWYFTPCKVLDIPACWGTLHQPDKTFLHWQRNNQPTWFTYSLQHTTMLTCKQFTCGWMGKICAIFVNGFLQHCPIMCWSRNHRSNKCEATIKVTYDQYILSFFFISPIDILANLTERYDNFDMCSIYCPYCIVEGRSRPMLRYLVVDTTESGVLGANYIYG